MNPTEKNLEAAATSLFAPFKGLGLKERLDDITSKLSVASIGLDFDNESDRAILHRIFTAAHRIRKLQSEVYNIECDVAVALHLSRESNKKVCVSELSDDAGNQ